VQGQSLGNRSEATPRDGYSEANDKLNQLTNPTVTAAIQAADAPNTQLAFSSRESAAWRAFLDCVWTLEDDDSPAAHPSWLCGPNTTEYVNYAIAAFNAANDVVVNRVRAIIVLI
jgi:hypothetical protein